MAGFCVVLVLIITCLIIAGIVLVALVFCVGCFINATTCGIVMLIKRKDIQKRENNIKWLVWIPIVLYTISLSIFLLFVLLVCAINCC